MYSICTRLGNSAVLKQNYSVFTQSGITEDTLQLSLGKIRHHNKPLKLIPKFNILEMFPRTAIGLKTDCVAFVYSSCGFCCNETKLANDQD